MKLISLLLLSRHTVVCQLPRKQKKTCGTQVCYLLVVQSCQIQPSVSPKLLSWFLPNYILSTKLYTFYLTYALLISKLKEIASAFLEVFVPGNRLHIFFFSSLHKITNIFKSYEKTFPCFNFLQIWNTNNSHLGLHFPKILRNSKKNWGSYVHNIAIFLQFVVAPTRCIINAMDLKIFPSTIILVKVNRLKDFQIRVTLTNWRSIVQVDVTVKITNLIITITNLTKA